MATGKILPSLPALAARLARSGRGRVGALRRRPSTPGDPPHPEWHRPGTDPWHGLNPTPAGWCQCNICRWSGPHFQGVDHSESAVCPGCGSIARDRFLFWSLQHSVERPDEGRLRLLETSPRLDGTYRRAMAQWFDYLCSDFDQRAHTGAIRIDLQDIDLPSDSIDVILSPHVLEHVPDYDRALAELYRVLRPGGTLLLQVPVLQERTAPPTNPEFHGDDTPVFWRFGPELGDRLAVHGFTVRLLATEALMTAAATAPDAGIGSTRPWPLPVSAEFDAEAVLRGLCPAVAAEGPARSVPPPRRLRPELQAVANPETAARHGFEPAYMFLTWAAHKATQRVLTS